MSTDRDEAIRAIRAALKRRTGRTWSVTGGRGTAWGWITVTAPPSRRVKYDYMTEADRRDLGEALGLDAPVHSQGVWIPAQHDYRTEYIDRAEGRPPSVVAVAYWD